MPTIYTNGTDNPAFNALDIGDFGDSAPVQYGLDGNDVMDPTLGIAYYLDGGRGNDFILSHGLQDIVIGGEGDDILVNRGGNDMIYGGAGNDLIAAQTNAVGSETMEGGSGDDLLDGGVGNDLLDGGRGLDKFSFSSALGPTNVDTIDDFRPTDDQFQLDATIFTELVPGALVKKAFFVGKKAHDGNDLIIYNPNKGTLQYDADHKGGNKGVVFALLDKDLDMSFADFAIVA